MLNDVSIMRALYYKSKQISRQLAVCESKNNNVTSMGRVEISIIYILGVS